MNINELVDVIGNLTVAELAELTSVMKERFNLQIMDRPLINSADTTVQVEEEEVEVDVILMGISDATKKIPILKMVRELMGLGLKESKEVMDSAPKALKEKITKEEAEGIKAKFESAGAIIEIKG